MITNRKRCDVLICIPCFNSQDTLEPLLGSLLRHGDADVLLVDDWSQQPLEEFVQERFPLDREKIMLVRPHRKMYSGGSKNIGIRTAIRRRYRIAMFLDSDIVAPNNLVTHIRCFFEQNPREVVVAPSILPYGKRCQYADTLINFSYYLPESYLPDAPGKVSSKRSLAGYAFALNMDVFRSNPCYHLVRYGGDDVLFFQKLKKHFGLKRFTLLNHAAVLHQPPRNTLRQALAAQKRYGRAFFAHNDHPREYLFNKLPLLHLLTPRFCLMLARLLRRRRFRDLAYVPLCWLLDFGRALQIVRLSFAGYRDPGRTE